MLTIIFATRNGARVLPRTLAGYCQLEQDSIKWKLIAVDNGSSDATSDILHAFSRQLPLQILHEPNPGKNGALNAALRNFEGPLAIFTDDDAVPLPSFLRAWARYLDTRVDYELIGGSIHPDFESPPPSWVMQDAGLLAMLFAARDLPEGPIRAAQIFGPNMAVRTSVFDRGFRFNEDIGPNASDRYYPMGGESEFCRKLERAGIRSWFAEEPAVRHFVRTHQLTDKYLAERSYRLGRGELLQRWNNEVLSGLIPRPVMAEGAAGWLRSLQMLSPFPLQRRRAIYRYFCERGFQDEYRRRVKAMRRGSRGGYVDKHRATQDFR